MRVAALVTGGKDSVLALWGVLNQGYEVRYLVTMIPQQKDSWMFHAADTKMSDLFSEAVGIPMVKGETDGVKEEEIEDLKSLLSTLDVEGIVSGCISSQYQKNRIDQMSGELNLKSISPLWQRKPLSILKEIIDLNFEVIIIGVYAYGLDQGWLGRKINSETIVDLMALNAKYRISLVGEGGEYETLVLDAPFFKKKILPIQTEKIWENQSGYLEVNKAELLEKF